MNKKFRVVLLIAFLSLFVACGGKDTNENNNNGNTPGETDVEAADPTIEEKLDDKTLTKQGDLIFSNIKISESGAMNTVSADVKNGGTVEKTFTLVLYMKDPSGKILGKVDKVVEKLPAGETVNVAIDVMGDYSNLSDFEVKVEE